jgi:hypothetical protein
MKAVFIGHFSPLSRALEHASSAAGNQVQRQIADEIARHCGNARAACFSMTPQPYWPRGPLLSSSETEGSIEFPGYLNLPVLKHFLFSLRLLGHLLATRPQLCLQYNSYLFENLTLLLYRLWRRGTAVAIIIQDIHVELDAPVLSKPGLLSLSARASLFFSRFFDLIVPISREIVEDFGMDPNKCLVFQGGATEFGTHLMNGPNDGRLADLGVFAGALEPHNGIDLLIERWEADGIDTVLHVFGRGSLAERVTQAAERCPNIVYHGFQPEHLVLDWQRCARWNFCLRYSVGIDQTYFFPSKLFNIVCAPGVVVVNDFHALPTSIKDHLCVVRDDLLDLAVRLRNSNALSSPARVEIRRQIVRAEHCWSSCVRQILGALQKVANA